MRVLRHLIAILVLPFTVTVLIPAGLLLWRGEPFVRTSTELAVPVAVLGLVPLALIGWTIWLFATCGKGTLAPWDETQRLVVEGPYRHVRNPMILGVMGVLLVEVMLARSNAIAVELALFVFANATWIPIREERGLFERFGTPYVVYARNVPRWLPRLSAWRGDDDGLPHRAADEIPLARLPGDGTRGLAVVHGLAVLFEVGLLLMLVSPRTFGSPSVWSLLAAGVLTWALLDLRDAWIDALREPPPDRVHVRVRDDGRPPEIRETPGGRPVLGWVMKRREKGAFVLMRRRVASRPLLRRLRPTEKPSRMAVLYEPAGRPDADGWVRYPASAVYDEPPGEWAPAP